MLFVDRPAVTATDLNTLDNQVAKIVDARNENIDLPALLERVHSECGQRLLANLENWGPNRYADPAGLGQAHLSAVFNLGLSKNLQATTTDLVNIVTNGDLGTLTGSVKSWMTYLSLAAVYRDAYSRKVDDKYLPKLTMYEGQAKDQWRTLSKLGIPIVDWPLPCPAALYASDSGEFSFTTPDAVGVFTPADYYAALTYTAVGYVSPTNRNNSESGLSSATKITLGSGKTIRADVTKLIPPAAATGWNLWVGPTADKLYLQTLVPVPIATKEYTISLYSTANRSHLGQLQDRRIVPVMFSNRV
jgi:hypothetical protein